MERSNEGSDLIDLGTASVETRGLSGMIPDWANGQEPHGLSDD